MQPIRTILSAVFLCACLIATCLAGDVRFSGDAIYSTNYPLAISASENCIITNAAPITLRPGAGVALRWKWTSAAAATNTVPTFVKFGFSLDGTNWPVNAPGIAFPNELVLRVPCQGAPGTNWQTNIQATVTTPFRAMKLYSVSNCEEQTLYITNFTWWINRYER